MTDDLRKRVVDYRTVVSVFKSMLKTGIITADEYEKLCVITAEKYGLNSCTIFR